MTCLSSFKTKRPLPASYIKKPPMNILSKNGLLLLQLLSLKNQFNPLNLFPKQKLFNTKPPTHLHFHSFTKYPLHVNTQSSPTYHCGMWKEANHKTKQVHLFTTNHGITTFTIVLFGAQDLSIQIYL